jgi:microsomal dipeptidase-like Zn-dependent dipeptidase
VIIDHVTSPNPPAFVAAHYQEEKMSNSRLPGSSCLGLLGILLACGLSARAEAQSDTRWGPVRKDGCTGSGLRQVSGPLRNVPFGADPVTACRHTPRNVMGLEFAAPDRCVREGLFGARGQWDVPDTSCLAAPPAAPVRGGDGAPSSSAPLEGYADLHVHQMGQLGFGGSVVWGGAFGAPAAVLGPIPSSMKQGHDKSEALFDGDILGALSGLNSHGESGYPTFSTWPSRTIATHQQAYEDWLFRAYQGGLRLMVMLAVNSEDMFGRGENDIILLGGVVVQPVKAFGRTGNDMEALEWQVREAYRMQADIDARSGGPGQGWYRIVRDPEEASAAIAEGKLAVILGTELQHLFNCDADRPACTPKTIADGLDRLEAMGVNYVFPIHHKLNQFGGPSQFNPLTNGPIENCFETTEPCSSVGLTPLGRTLVQELMARGMLIDTEHMSWKAFDDAMSLVEAQGYPVLASHINPFDLRIDGQTEFLRKTAQFRRILGVGGIVGISSGTPAEEYSSSRTEPVRVPIACGGASSWANAYLYARDLAGGGLSGESGRVTIGTDWNGFSGWPGPRRGASACTPRSAQNGQPIAQPGLVSYPITLPPLLLPAAAGGTASLAPFTWLSRTWDYNTEGLMNAGLMPELFEDMRLLGFTVADLEPLYRSARGVVELWRTAREREVPGDRHRVRWVPQSPFDTLPFQYGDAARTIEARAGFPLCRSRVGNKLGFERDGACQLVEAPLPTSSSPVEISAYHAGRCLDVQGGSTSDGAAVVQSTCQAVANQKWQLRASDAAWEIVNAQSGKCLEVPGGSTATGASVQQGACQGVSHQKWMAVRSGNTFSLRAQHSGLCLTVFGQSRSSGAKIQQSTCTGASHQLWSIEALRQSDHEMLYQADLGRTAWRATADADHPLPITVDGTRSVCRSADASQWVGVVAGSQCVGRDYAGVSVSTTSFERLFQAR